MATKQQIPVLAARLVEFQEEFSNLPTEDAQWAIMNGKDAVALCAKAIANRAKENVGKKNAEKVMPVLSGVVSAATIAASIKKFVVKDKFKVDTSRKAKVKISYLGNNFKEWFLGKTEEPFFGSTVYNRKLYKASVDGPILSEFGDQEKAETTLTEIYGMMEYQTDGESGDLLNNGWANIFYVRDITDNLRAVYVVWGKRGWDVDARLFNDPYGWDAGFQVFSRNSLVPRNI